MKKIKFIFLTAISMLAFVQKSGAQDDDYSIKKVIGELEFPNEKPMTVDSEKSFAASKNVSSPTSDGTYWIKLETFATGSAVQTVSSKPSDIILILDYSTSMDSDRRSALRTAVQTFLTTIYNNDQVARGVDQTYAGDRVAIITFNSSSSVLYSLQQINSNYQTMYSNFNNDFTTGRNTNPGEALSDAMEQWTSGTDPNRTRAVVVFTDGCPSQHGSYAFDCDYAKTAIDNANTLKSSYGASVYSVGLFTTGTTQWNAIGAYVLDYMNFMSSNFTGVTSTATAGDTYSGNNAGINGSISYSFPTYSNISSLTEARASDMYSDAAEAEAATQGFFFMATQPSALESIFKTIAQQSQGTTNTSLSAATSTVDIVSSSFKLPDGATKNNIKVFTALCTYANADSGTYTFAKEILAPNSNDTYRKYTTSTAYTLEDVDKDIDVEISGNEIKVNGFDYSGNWCGPITQGSSVVGYQGHKVIIMIPIQMNPDAVGGPNVPTNEEGSGVYVNDDDDEPLIPFESPTVSLPVNIYIEKSGLNEGESAKFILERAIIPDDFDEETGDFDALDWNYVSSFFVTNGDHATLSNNNNPMVKIKGLPSTTMENGVQKDLIYRIREDGWSWSYDRDETPQYTVTSKVTNPFTFTNTPKENIDIIVRHAESKATNTFKTGGGATFDDSKTNTRTTNESN